MPPHRSRSCDRIAIQRYKKYLKMQMKKEIIFIIILCVLLFICFGAGYTKGKKSIDIQADTVKIEKVITEFQPRYTSETKLSTQKIKIPIYAAFPEITNRESIDSLKRVIDSLKWDNDILNYTKDSLEIELQRVQRYYHTDDYEAWVSGIDPALDSIKIKQQIRQITNTQTIKKDIFCLNVGLNSTNISKEACIINPNINASFTWDRISLIGEVGFDIPINNTTNTLPYFQLGINYTLWTF